MSDAYKLSQCSGKFRIDWSKINRFFVVCVADCRSSVHLEIRWKRSFKPQRALEADIVYQFWKPVVELRHPKKKGSIFLVSGHSIRLFLCRLKTTFSSKHLALYCPFPHTQDYIYLFIFRGHLDICFHIGVIHKSRGQNFGYFWPPSPLRGYVY